MKIHWSESMATGVAEIDNQHQSLAHQLNQLDDLVSDDATEVDAERVIDLLDYFEVYSREHFEIEERQMDVFECDAADQNRTEHQEFIELVHRFQRLVQENGVDMTLVRQLRDELFEWCERHWREVDSKLRVCVMHCRTCPIT